MSDLLHRELTSSRTSKSVNPSSSQSHESKSTDVESCLIGFLDDGMFSSKMSRNFMSSSKSWEGSMGWATTSWAGPSIPLELFKVKAILQGYQLGAGQLVGGKENSSSRLVYAVRKQCLSLSLMQVKLSLGIATGLWG